MNERTIKLAIFSAVIALSSLTSCTKNDGPGGNSENGSGPDNSPRQFITLTAAFPDADNTAGNGGTLAYSISQEDAGNPNKEINVFADGYALRSQRTARVQGSVNGNFLYNIQYTGANGGVFNKYRVSGGKQFDDTNEELNVSSTLGTSPRWVKAAEGVGIGVNISGASAPVDIAKAEAGTPQTYTYTRGTASVAIINLDDPSVPNTTEFAFPLTDAEKEAGYSVTRLDVPIINGGKVFIGCAVSKVDPTKAPVKTTNRAGEVTWGWASDAPNIKGTATLVLDYPSLANPKLIWSTQSKYGNNSYRTMTQYVGTDGNVYQSTGVNTTSYPHILRINRSTGDYDNTYLFDLSKALGTSNLTGIKAWRYIQDGIGIVLYTETNVAGGYIALVDLNAKTATKLATEIQSDAGFSGATGLTGTLTQFQNIGLAGDFAYVPMTPNGKDGNLYIVNWKTKTITKGIKLKGQAGSFFLGAY